MRHGCAFFPHIIIPSSECPCSPSGGLCWPLPQCLWGCICMHSHRMRAEILSTKHTHRHTRAPCRVLSLLTHGQALFSQSWMQSSFSKTNLSFKVLDFPLLNHSHQKHTHTCPCSLFALHIFTVKENQAHVESKAVYHLTHYWLMSWKDVHWCIRYIQGAFEN